MRECTTHRSDRRGRHSTLRGQLAWLLAVGVTLALGGTARPATAQGGGVTATRDELTAALAQQANGGGKREGAVHAAIRARLSDGDFEPGDRVVLVVQGDSALTDTFTVRAGSTLQLPGLPELALRGVLRSELEPHLHAFIARYYRDPVVRATALMRVGILGEVSKPGYYSVPADLPLADVLMTAGGLAERADVKKTVVRRGKGEVLSRSAARRAMNAGATLDQLNLRAGDEIVVGEKPQISWETSIRAAALVAGVVFGLMQ